MTPILSYRTHRVIAEAHRVARSPRGRTLVLDRSRTEAELLGRGHVGTEHLLLGMVRRDDTVAAVVLGELGADAARMREQVAATPPSTDPADQPKPPPFRPPARDAAAGDS
jgi:ATP-dependent Clp protease ATP-binding subunit ClpA